MSPSPPTVPPTVSPCLWLEKSSYQAAELLTRPFPAPETVLPTPPVTPPTVPRTSPCPKAVVVSVTVELRPLVVFPRVFCTPDVAPVAVLPTPEVTCLTGLPTPESSSVQAINRQKEHCLPPGSISAPLPKVPVAALTPAFAPPKAVPVTPLTAPVVAPTPLFTVPVTAPVVRLTAPGCVGGCLAPAAATGVFFGIGLGPAEVAVFGVAGDAVPAGFGRAGTFAGVALDCTGAAGVLTAPVEGRFAAGGIGFLVPTGVRVGLLTAGEAPVLTGVLTAPPSVAPATGVFFTGRGFLVPIGVRAGLAGPDAAGVDALGALAVAGVFVAGCFLTAVPPAPPATGGSFLTGAFLTAPLAVEVAVEGAFFAVDATAFPPAPARFCRLATLTRH